MVFPSHFEDDPNVPGFIQIESLVQTFIMTFLSLDELKGNTTNFLKINNAIFKRKVLPGDVTTIFAELKSLKGDWHKAVLQALLTMKKHVAQSFLFQFRLSWTHSNQNKVHESC